MRVWIFSHDQAIGIRENFVPPSRTRDSFPVWKGTCCAIAPHPDGQSLSEVGEGPLAASRAARLTRLVALFLLRHTRVCPACPPFPLWRSLEPLHNLTNPRERRPRPQPRDAQPAAACTPFIQLLSNARPLAPSRPSARPSPDKPYSPSIACQAISVTSCLHPASHLPIHSPLPPGIGHSASCPTPILLFP